MGLIPIAIPVGVVSLFVIPFWLNLVDEVKKKRKEIQNMIRLSHGCSTMKVPQDSQQDTIKSEKIKPEEETCGKKPVSKLANLISKVVRCG